MTYIPRVLEAAVNRYLALFPVVGLTGPRQSGKSTMIRKLLQDRYRYVSFDDPNIVDRFHADPEAFMSVYNDNVIFDEVQRVPELFQYVKLIVDNDRARYGRFVMTGSSQFSLLKRISESLAGRIGLLTLLPFQHAEVPPRLRESSIYQGSYPELVGRKYAGAFEWYTSYLDTYFTRDLRELWKIGDMRDFKRCVQVLAARVSQILNMSDLSRDIGVSVPTVKSWISILEASFVIFLLPAYHNNLGKRIVKSPKVYFFDTGLVSHLTGIRTKELYEQGPLHGPLFENYLVSEIYKKELHCTSGAELFFYRTSNGVEVDLIVDRKTRRELIEIKTGQTYRPPMTSSISRVMREGEQGFLLYQGKALASLPDLHIMNFADYLA